MHSPYLTGFLIFLKNKIALLRPVISRPNIRSPLFSAGPWLTQDAVCVRRDQELGLHAGHALLMELSPGM